MLQNPGEEAGGLNIDAVFESATQQVEDECTKAEGKSSQVPISETEKERIISDLMRLTGEPPFREALSPSYFCLTDAKTECALVFSSLKWQKAVLPSSP